VLRCGGNAAPIDVFALSYTDRLNNIFSARSDTAWHRSRKVHVRPLAHYWTALDTMLFRKAGATLQA